ncbi:hypothetical protein Cflav_PD5634 [Pedosphaera parvula Ellin514]|uniref:Uncharacterized protein n=1 Tax=Pedosphaera parvula (strain Ellin514) TaxID=320771 RepID=B9XAG4_PEDPL|nr:hypothetical protein Cflav_PD5634 [Pedosphaera parvula Ellin514]
MGVGREGAFGEKGPELRKNIRCFLGQGGIKLDCEESLLDASSTRMKIHFVNEASELGKRVTFAQTSRGKVMECREELRLGDFD